MRSESANHAGMWIQRMSKTSFLRMLPALFVGLLPFNLLEDYLLEQHYRLRGVTSPSQNLQVVRLSEADLSSRVSLLLKLKKKTENFNPRCVSLLPQALNLRVIESGWSCLHLKSQDIYTSETLLASIGVIQKHFGMEETLHLQPLFFAPSDFFETWYLTEFEQRGQILNESSVLIFHTAEMSEPKIFISTPMGPMGQTDALLNVVAAVLEKSYLKRFDRFGQWMFTLFAAFLVLLVLYAYPVFFTLVLVSVMSLVLWATSLFVFERMGWQLPVAASWTTLVLVYLLGMTDRLDKRERKEWILEQESSGLRKLDEMRNNFLSLVSHDLKTPIARIRLTLERFLRADFGVLSEDQRIHLTRVLSASGDLQRSISTLLLLSRIETRELSIKAEPSDLVEVLEQSITQHVQELADRSIVIERDFEPLFLAEFDKALILEVINNLLDNAIKYSPKGTKIFIRCGELDNCPELSPPQPGLWFEVQDQGAGIDVEERSSVFKKFFQGSRFNAPRDQELGVKGTGLGLYLSHYFVQEHGGSIRVYSRLKDELLAQGNPALQYFNEQEGGVGHGTVFRVSLPIEPPAENPNWALRFERLT